MKQQSIVAISAFTASGKIAELKEELNRGLDAGLTISDIKEIMVQLYAYAGFPRSLNALQVFMDVLKDREQKSIQDNPGKAASPLPADKTKLQFGTEMQTKLVGQPVQGDVYTFAPAIDTFLKEHLFGDIFGRDNLDWKTRELATISALAALGNVQNQLRSHFNVGMHNGLTAGELTGAVAVIESKVGAKEGRAAAEVLQTVLHPSNKQSSLKDSESLNGNSIFAKGEKAPDEYFSGTAWVTRLIPQDETGTYSVGNVVFEPRARTAWHKHPAGQTLLVTDGTGWYQEKGKPARAIKKGDVVIIPSNTEHWHGAAKKSSLTHIALTNLKDGGVVWLEKVTDEEYDSLTD